MLLPFPSPAAEKTAQPIDIDSRTLAVRSNENLALFEGNVRVTQGDLTLRAESVRVRYHTPESRVRHKARYGVSTLEAQRRVVVTVPGKTAEADAGVYDVDRGRVTLSGKVRLKEGSTVLTGSNFAYDVATGISTLTNGVPEQGSAAEGGRARAVFVPKKKSAAEKAPKTAPAGGKLPASMQKPKT